MGYNISNFDQHMHIVRDVHFDVNKYKVGELYVIKHNITNAHTIDGKMVGKLIKAEVNALTFDIFTEVIPEGILPTDPHRYYGITTITLLLDDIIERQIEIERLMTESEADFRTVNMITQGQLKENIPEPDKSDDKYKGDLSIYTGLPTTPPSHIVEQLKSDIHAAYKINTPEEEKKNYVVWLTSTYDGSSKPFSILDSEGNFDSEPFKGLSNCSGRVWVKLVKGGSTVQFNVLSKYIKVTSDEIIITRNKDKSSILCMTLMRDNFREMFDKIEFEQIL